VHRIIPCETLLRWTYKIQYKEEYEEKVDTYIDAAECIICRCT